MATKLLGSDDATGWEDRSPNIYTLTRFQAVASGTMNEFRVKSVGAGNIKCAIYADSAGEPAALLNALNTAQAVAANWNTISFTSTAITSGTYYWLAVNLDTTGVVEYVVASGFTMRYKTGQTFATFNFPDPAGTGYSTLDDYKDLVAGWEEAVAFLPKTSIM